MVYLIGRQVIEGVSIPFIEGTRVEIFSHILSHLENDLTVATDEIGNVEKFLDYLGIDYMRVTGGPNAQFYDHIVDYQDDVEKLIGFDRFIALQGIKNYNASERLDDSVDDAEKAEEV